MSHSERTDAHLARTLHALTAIEADAQTPSYVEAAVMARWDAARTTRASSRTRRTARAAAAAAAGLTLVGMLAWPGDVSRPIEQRVSRSPRYTTVAVVGGPLMAGEPVRVVRMRVARSVLGELGLPSPTVPVQADAAVIDTVDIDVLVGEDGVARGVRVPISDL